MKMKINNKQIKSLFLLSLVGSNLAKEESSNNQTEIAHSNEINLNSLPQLGVNLTDAKITDENSSEQIDFFAGYPISIENQRNCTTSYALIISDCQDAGKNGFITSSRCCVNCNGVDNISGQDGSLLGSSLYSSIVPLPPRYPSDLPLDYLYINANLPGINVKFLPYVAGLTNNDQTVSEIYPIASS